MANRCCATETTSSWGSSYFAWKSSERKSGAIMTVCNRCGKENQDHYKFCLGCGAELTAAPKPGGDVGMMKTMMADTGAPGGPLAGLGGMPGGGAPLGGG